MSKLSSKQIKAINLLSVGTNYRQCAKMLKISRYTLWQWRHDPLFAQTLEEEKEKHLTNYIEDLDKLKKKAIATLTNFLDDNSIPLEKRISIAFDAINTAKYIEVKYLN